MQDPSDKVVGEASRSFAGRASMIFVVVLFAFSLSGQRTWASDWPQWRGPNGTGASSVADPPIHWSEVHNVAWKVELEGLGSSSPIVWGDRIFITTAIDTGRSEPGAEQSGVDSTAGGGRGKAPASLLDFVVACHDRVTGRRLWRTVVATARPHEGTHPDGTYASPSPVTDGERVYAFFGSYGIHALDLDGRLIWSVDLGDMRTRLGFGEGSSPSLAGEGLVVNWDEEGESFIVALSRRTGEELWRQPRDESTSWSTPLVVDGEGGRQVIVSATNRVRSYAVADGRLLWEERGMTQNVIPTPVAGDGVVFVTSGFRGSALLALRLGPGSSGQSRVLWSYGRDTPYVPSPLLYQGVLYFLKVNNAIVTAVDAKTGNVLDGPRRLESLANVYASPVAAAGRIIFVGREGESVVMAAGKGGEILAKNSLDDRFDASPALAGGDLVLRGRRHLYLVREAASGASD